MIVKPSDTVAVQFTTQAPTTGAAANADSLPTGVLVKNGDDTAETVTVTNIATGVYKASVAIPSGYVAGDEVQLRIAATVASVAGKAVIWSGEVDTARESETYGRIGANGAGLTALGDARLNNLDAAVSSRSTLAAGAQMDLVNAPNATAISAIQSGLATAAKLLNLVKSLARKDATVDSDIGGTYVPATDSLEALGERITSAAITVVDAVDGSEITAYRGTTWGWDLTVGALTGNSKLWFTLKDDVNKDDSDAILQVEKTDGLVRFNGAAGTALDASLVVNNEATGDITLTVKPSTTRNAVPRKGFVWDVKVLIGTVVTVKARGTLDILADVTRSVS